MLATNVFPSLIVRNRLQTVPVYDYVLATEPLSDAQLDRIGWVNRQGIGDSANQFHYYRLSADNRIVWGGYDAIYRFGRKVKPGIRRPARQTTADSQQHFFITFPQLDDVRFSHRWAGAIDTSTRFCAHWGLAHGDRVAYVNGFTGLGVGAARFAADVCLDLLEGKPTERTELEMVRKRPLPFPPEPLASIGIQATRWSLDRADHSAGTAICCSARSMHSGSASIPDRPLIVCKTFGLGRSERPTCTTTISRLSHDWFGKDVWSMDGRMSPSERGNHVADRLAIGEKLERGQSLTSRNGAYTLTLQDDGNLVLAAQGQAVWATGTNGQDAERLEVQKDGNVVLYTPDKPIWHTDTKGAKDVRLILQDDRNVVVYGFDGVAWASGTNTDEAPPPPAGAEEAAPEVAPAAAEEPLPPAEAPRPAASATAAAATAPRTYTVVSGDTLWAISERFYGDGSKYQRIADASGISNPDLIHPGQVLTIP